MQYREAGVLLWRGFTLQEFANQLFSNKYDNGKGRQMPAHYGSKKHNYFTIASTIAWVLKALIYKALMFISRYIYPSMPLCIMNMKITEWKIYLGL